MNLGDYQGLFTASIGLFNLVASYFLFRKRNVDSNILYLLTGITLTFVSLTAPIQLHGNNITLFWASETVLLYWLFKKSGIGIIKYASALIWLLALVSLVLDWEGIYTSYETRLPVIINKGFITSVFLAVATWCLFLLKRKGDPAADNQFLPGRNLLRIVALLILYSAGALEINFQFRHYYPDTSYQVLYLLLYTMLFIIVFEFITNRVASLRLNWKIIAILLSVAVIFYLLVIPVSFDIQKSMLETNKPNGLFAAHWISAILAGLILYKLVQLVRVNRALIITVADTVTWVLCTIIVVWLSLEGQLLSNMIFYAKNNPLEDTTRIYIKTGLPILWGICSFVFMWLGMHYKYKTLRIISLSLFTLTLLKLFLFDISNIPAGGKIAAFFCLGVLLLVVSFMYQRLKKIIIEDEEKTA
jgi:uncharacterized membrane protein